MSDESDHPSHAAENAAIPADARTPGNDDDLPLVEPPSAGFIIQLFLVPGLIVLVVVGVWALFGRLAGGEQNWERLVQEIREKNPHRRWRGAMGLAQLLQVDQKLGDDGEKLAENPDVAKALTKMFREELEAKSSKPDDVSQRAFLARALGTLDVHDVVLPVLMQAMKPAGDADSHKEIRKNSIASVAVIAGRAKRRDASKDPSVPGPRLKAVVEFPSLLDDIVSISKDDDPLIRQLGAYTLGLLPSPRSRQRLEVLLDDSDEKTRVNAAVALARQNSTNGLPVFENVLKNAATAEAEQAKIIPGGRKATRYFWIGIAIVALFVFAVWAAGTTHRGNRMLATVLSLATLIFICHGIYELVHDQPETWETLVEESSTDGEPATEAEIMKRRRQAHALRFEQLVTVRNTLKAIAELGSRFEASDKTRLTALIEPIAKEYGEPSIRIDAQKALQALK